MTGILDARGDLQHEPFFDAWGMRVAPAAYHTAKFRFSGAGARRLARLHETTRRGHTGHEMLDEVGLVHANGRLYDPELGRFLSPDPFVQFAGNLQSHNPYAYVLNNPATYTDPSGYNAKRYVGAAVTVVLTAFAPWGSGFWAQVSYGAIGGGVGAAANGGNVLEGAVIGGATAAAFAGVAQGFGAASGIPVATAGGRVAVGAVVS